VIPGASDGVVMATKDVASLSLNMIEMFREIRDPMEKTT
jgi:hypothetical protein